MKEKAASILTGCLRFFQPTVLTLPLVQPSRVRKCVCYCNIGTLPACFLSSYLCFLRLFFLAELP